MTTRGINSSEYSEGSKAAFFSYMLLRGRASSALPHRAIVEALAGQQSSFNPGSYHAFVLERSDNSERLRHFQRTLVVEESPKLEALLSRIEQLESTVEAQQFHTEHAVQPTLSRVTRLLEGVPGESGSPPVSSAGYEWYVKFTEILDVIDKVIGEFEDLRARLSAYTGFQKWLDDLLNQMRSRGSHDLRHAVLTIYDAVHSVYSEDLTCDQLQAIRDSLERLRGSSISMVEVRSIDRLLRNVGFETIPSDRSRYLPHDG